jgi:hypothetical protein
MSRRRPSTIDAAPAIQRGKPDSSPEQDARRPDTSFPLEAHLGMARYVSAEISICTELHLRVTKYRSLHDTFVPLRELCTEIGDYMPDLIAGKYLVVEGTKARIGGHSSVRKAVDITTGNFYAIKFITGRGDSNCGFACVCRWSIQPLVSPGLLAASCILEQVGLETQHGAHE